jgi:hypothetical protein
MTTLAEIQRPAPRLGEASANAKTPKTDGAFSVAQAMRLVASIALYSFLPYLFISNSYIVDPDIWWHLRTGQWILSHHAVPVTDPFSIYGMDKPWIVYSWLFDVLNAALFGRVGLAAIAGYEIAVRLALGLALFHLVRGLFRGFWRGAAITLLGLGAMTSVIGPRPGMLTILLIIVEFDILLTAQKTGQTNRLWLLPPIFILWANFHIQFVYGLFVLSVFASEPVLNGVLGYTPRGETGPCKRLWQVLGASFAATLLNPYGIRIYSTVFGYMTQTGVYNIIAELRAMTFREPQDFLVLFLVLGAMMAIGWRRDPRPLWLVFIAVTSILAFRSIREVWFLVIVSICVIVVGWEPARQESHRGRTALRERGFIAIWVLAIVIASCRHYGLTKESLEVEVAGSFPEAAAQFILQHHLRGPLFNDLSWGGFLIWRLPNLPVAMDGRTNVHGDARILEFSRVWTGKPDWASDPELAKANVVITPRVAAIASLLRTDPRFALAYEDMQAAVFERK